MADALPSVDALRLDRESWARFGWIPVADSDPADGIGRLEFSWGDPHLNIISHDASEVPRSGDSLVCEMLYRHDSHTQALMVLDNDAVIAVAPASAAFDEAGDIMQLTAFVLHQLDILVLGRGTWHWGPFPVRDSTVHLLNLQGMGYLKDNTMVDLAAAGLACKVRAGG